ncbi:MAG TPA: hypothetical protein VL357_01925 [Rariglobus sp.]|nr:hypothetical protein [Rariglobus sp.]
MIFEAVFMHAESPVDLVLAVHFPDMPLKKKDGERVEQFEITLTCASFHQIDKIPEDWSVIISSPVSGVSHCRGESGHGAATLWSIHDLDEMISVRFQEKDEKRFDISARIWTTSGAEYSFTKSQLIRKKEPSQSPEPMPMAVTPPAAQASRQP